MADGAQVTTGDHAERQAIQELYELAYMADRAGDARRAAEIDREATKRKRRLSPLIKPAEFDKHFAEAAKRIRGDSEQERASGRSLWDWAAAEARETGYEIPARP